MPLINIMKHWPLIILAADNPKQSIIGENICVSIIKMIEAGQTDKLL